MPRRGEGAGGAPESILKPFKNQQKTRALPVRKPAKFGQVFSPTKAIFGRGTHNEFE
ncbi:MAG: hypothetical protein RI957_1431, partial [Verrucomicrobiota bacterium]